MLKVIMLSQDGLVFEYDTKEKDREKAIKLAAEDAKKKYPEEYSLKEVRETK